MTRPLQPSMDSNVSVAHSDHVADEAHKDVYLSPGSSIRNRIYVNFDQPAGTIHHMTFTVDPQMTVASFKADLTYVTKIPAEFVTLTHRNKVLHDDKMLQEQGVQHKDFIVLTDSRLSYCVPTHTAS